MALFGKLDGDNVSPLTSFYQVSPTQRNGIRNPFGSELDVWLYRNTKGEPYTRELWSGEWGHWGEPEYHPNPFEPEDTLDFWVEFHELIVRLMNAAAEAIAEGRRVTAEDMTPADIDIFNSRMLNAFKPNQMVTDARQDGSLVITNRTFYTSNIEYQTQELLRRVLMEFTEAFNKSAFVYCEQCGSVYAAIRNNGRFAEQKVYCSERCSTRARQNRKRDKEKVIV